MKVYDENSFELEEDCMEEKDYKFKRRECKDCAPCRPKHPLPKPVILACGQGFDLDLDEIQCRQFRGFPCDPRPRTIANVTVDTSCLCKPIVKLDFSCNIQFEAETVRRYRRYGGGGYCAQEAPEQEQEQQLSEEEAEQRHRTPDQVLDYRLQFVLIKCCNGCEEELGTWIYRRDFKEEDERDEHTLSFGDTFSFTFCECNTCPACCTYKVEVRKLRELGDIEKELISRPAINAIAQGACCD